MNDNGALQVNEFLQVTGNDDIFSLGDCCASGAAWMAYHAGEQAKVVIENIKRKTKGSKLKPYKIGTTFIFAIHLDLATAACIYMYSL